MVILLNGKTLTEVGDLMNAEGCQRSRSSDLMRRIVAPRVLIPSVT